MSGKMLMKLDNRINFYQHIKMSQKGQMCQLLQYQDI